MADNAGPSTNVGRSGWWTCRRPMEVDLARAQNGVNFSVLAPGQLPPDCAVSRVTLRPEQPPGRPPGIAATDLGGCERTEGNPCSLRIEIAGRRRTLRLKEFLYDFGPTSAGIAPLWGSREVVPLRSGEQVGWLGQDYRSAVGGCAQIDRTQVEFRVTGGSFTPHELTDVLAGLTAVCPDAGRAWWNAPFHDRNYWIRYRCPAMGVPYGLWVYDRSRRYHRVISVGDPSAEGPVPLPQELPAREGRFILESAVVMRADELDHCEVEGLYRHFGNGSDHVWVSVMNADSQLAVDVPPRREPMLFASRSGEVVLPGAGRVWIAAVDPAVGAMEARWERDRVRRSVWTSPSVHLGVGVFEELLVQIGSMQS